MTWPTKTDFVDGDVLTAAQVNNIGTNLNEFDPTSATSGQVWIADGAGSGAYGSAGGGMTLIQSINLTSGTRHTISGIPGTYQSLYIRVANPTATGGPGGLGIEVNGLTNFYKNAYRFANSTPTVTADAYVTTYLTSTYPNFLIGFGTVTNVVELQFWAEIHDYARASTPYKTIYGQATGYESSRYTVRESLGFNYNSGATSAITSVSLYGNGVTFTGGTFELYGVK